MNTPEIIANIIGFAVACIGFYSITLKSDEKLTLYQMLLNILLIFHFLLLGFYASAVVAFFISLRIAFAYKYNNNYTYSFFMIVPFFQAAYMYNQEVVFFEYFGLISSLIATHVYFKLKKIPMRIGFILGGILWCFLGYYTESYFVLLTNFVGIIIHVSTIFRIKKDSKIDLIDQNNTDLNSISTLKTL